jgi:hypothetical protein
MTDNAFEGIRPLLVGKVALGRDIAAMKNEARIVVPPRQINHRATNFSGIHLIGDTLHGYPTAGRN